MKLQILRGIVLGVCVASASLTPAQSMVQIGPSNADPIQLAVGSNVVYEPTFTNYPLFQYGPLDHNFVPSSSPAFIRAMGVGGGNLFQADEKWILDNGTPPTVWRFDPPTQKWQSIITDKRSLDIAVGPGYGDTCHPYEVWMPLLDPTQGWFAERFNYCTKAFVPIPSIPSIGSPWKVVVGGGEVWGVNIVDRVFRFNAATGQWQLMPGSLAQLAVGVDGVWGIDSWGNIFEFNPVSQTFDSISGQLMVIAAGGNGVWGVNFTNQVYRYEASTRSFVQVFGAQLATIVVGTGGGVWGYAPTNTHIKPIFSFLSQ